MSDYVNNALLDASPMKKQKEEAKALVAKWDKTGLLDGLNEDFQKSGMATLLENQARELIKENSFTNLQGTTNEEEWSGVALPLVRRIFSSIAAQEFVSVQPMNLPSGLVFYLDFKYGTDISGGGFTKSEAGLFGKTGPLTPSGAAAPYGESGLYGDTSGSVSRYDYSINTTESVITAAQMLAVGVAVGTASAADFNHNTELSASIAAAIPGGAVTPVVKFQIPLAYMKDADLTAIRSFEFASDAAGASSHLSASNFLPELTKVVGNNIQIVAFPGRDSTADATWASPESQWTGSAVKVTYSKQPTAEARGDFEDKVGVADDNANLGIPQVDLQLNSLPIVAKTRKLKAVWTPELAQDLNAYHSIDAEAELTSMLSEYVSMEIDLEILDMLIGDAVSVDYWSAKPGNEYDSNTNEFTSANISNFLGTRFEWWQTLVQKIQKMSNEIHKLTLRGGANFCVVGPKVATILESLPGYMSDTDGAQPQFAMGVQKTGAIAGRFTVYKNPYMTENTILVGFRGSNFLETGAVYAPYVPLIMTPLVYDPEDFTPRKGVMTRYAKKMVRPEFYGKIHVANLELV